MALASRHIIIVAGEVSGDMHASLLVKELRHLDPGLSFSGLGGPQMAEAGVVLDEDMTRTAVVGFIEVLKHLQQFRRIFRQILEKIQKQKPAAVILVDYPGFNLRLANEVKKLGVPVIYYISPQVWAWKENRVRLIRRVVDRMLVFFDFEKKFYARYGYDVDFVGHPLVEHIRVNHAREDVLLKNNLSPEKLTIGLLPGSRKKEIEKILPPMLSAAEKLYQQFPKIQFILLRAHSIPQKDMDPLLKRCPVPIVSLAHQYDILNACDLCLVASGTATLETAILQKPMVVIYRTAFLTWLLARMLVKIPYIGLVNVVAGKKIVPECIQFDATGEKIAQELRDIITDEVRIAQIRSDLRQVRESLGQPGASRRAAEHILSFLNSR